MINSKRIRILKKGPDREGHVLYWMSRDQRVNDNWALIHAVETAENAGQSVVVVFALADHFLDATWRQYDFLLKGLKKVDENLSALNIPFYILIGNPDETIPFFVAQHRISRLICDFDPLRIKQEWKQKVIRKVNMNVEEVDAHNIVPCWLASDKREFAAYTFRPRIQRLLPEFMDEYPPLVRQHTTYYTHRINWEVVSLSIKTDHSVRPVSQPTPGETGAHMILDRFLDSKMEHYAQNRNDPNASFTSGLSPYLHFGHISAQRIALEILKLDDHRESREAFLEELIIRKELSDNFCYYTPDYDQFEALHPWAKQSLNEHRPDRREFLYTPGEFELAKTHDPLWNAAQKQLLFTGAMHGYMRMYWGKKILEWSPSPEEALSTAIYLNDKYELDGRDPNGYTGCAWSMGGLHDRAWQDRSVYGKIRYMSTSACKRKFDVAQYIQRMNQLR